MRRGEDTSFERQPLSVLIGPQYSRVNIKVVRQLSAIRVDFVPGGMYRMLHVPMSELFDDGFDAVDFFGSEMSSLNERLKNVVSLEAGKEVVEKFLLGKVTRLKAILPFDSAMHTMLKSGGNMTIEQAAALACLSIKQFERKCKERIGMNPKSFARVVRFSKAYRLHERVPDLSWIRIAHEVGYHDQMHMIRDFRDFADANPSVIEKQLLSTPLRMQKVLRD
jgi:AraC-like DNA-binding protein